VSKQRIYIFQLNIYSYYKPAHISSASLSTPTSSYKMVSHLPILILLATSTYAADNFRNILNAIEGTSEGRSVLSNLPSQVLQNLAQNPQDAGEFVCYLMDGDATGKWFDTISSKAAAKHLQAQRALSAPP
jgi:hypothetical protein